MTKKEFDVIITLKNALVENYPRWREGQCLFNAIYYINPEIGNAIRGTLIDPFHVDDNIDKCLKYLKTEYAYDKIRYNEE